MPSVQQRYFDVLITRVSGDKYPSHQMLDRLEAAVATPEQLAAYVDVLVDKVDECWYPSGQILDRIQRMFGTVARAA
jgi:ubiquinone biosynthesis protein COQ9